jgi:hypothetical protein
MIVKTIHGEGSKVESFDGQMVIANCNITVEENLVEQLKDIRLINSIIYLSDKTIYTNESGEFYNISKENTVENLDHLKKKIYSLKVNGWENKNKIVEGLVESGYIIGAELEKDNLGRTKGWRIDVYE